MATPVVELIRRLKGDRNQSEYARFLGVDKSTVSRVLAGERPADSLIVRLLERYPEQANEIATAVSQSVEAVSA